MDDEPAELAPLWAGVSRGRSFGGGSCQRRMTRRPGVASASAPHAGRPRKLQGRRRRAGAAVAYGVGLALTFDEFGLWLHLGGSSWQRASYDAVVTLAALLGLIAVAPALRHFR